MLGSDKRGALGGGDSVGATPAPLDVDSDSAVSLYRS